MLMIQMNTLEYKLLPLSLLDSRVNRLIRNIDTGLVNKTAEALRAENQAILTLKKAIGLYSRRTEIAQQFIIAQLDEGINLHSPVAALLADNFKNHLGGLKPASRGNLVDAAPVHLFLSIGGGSIGIPKHPLQTSPEAAILDNLGFGDGSHVPFENAQTRANLRKSYDDIREERKVALPDVNVSFGDASIAAAIRSSKKAKTSVGDVILEKDGVLLIATGMLPKAPRTPKTTFADQTLAVTWSSNRETEEEAAIPTAGFDLRYRPGSQYQESRSFS